MSDRRRNGLAAQGATRIIVIMKSARLLPALGLLLWAQGAEAQRLPTRAQVESAVNAWFACHAGTDCGEPFRRRLSRSRCLRQPRDRDHPRRILCLFSGVNIGGGAATTHFRNDCVYMMPNRNGRWQVSSIPDADVCE